MKELYNVKLDNQGRILCQDYPTDDNLITIDPPKFKYVQTDDLERDDFQELNISMDSSGVGYYFVIETKRWAFTDIDELVKILEDYQKRFVYRENNTILPEHD